MGANAVTSVPVYTAGEILTAADLNITNSGIPVFADSSARDAAFGGTGEKVLAEGQYAFLESTNATQFYDGATWQAVGASGLVFITSGSMTLGSQLSFDNCFSATYANYLIKLTHTAGNNPQIRLRVGGSDITAANYDNQGVQVLSNVVSGAGSAGQTSWTVGNGTGYGNPSFNLGNPFASTNTSINNNDYSRTDSNILQIFVGRYNATTSADGFSVIGTSMTITARVYGYANS